MIEKGFINPARQTHRHHETHDQSKGASPCFPTPNKRQTGENTLRVAEVVLCEIAMPGNYTSQSPIPPFPPFHPSNRAAIGPPRLPLLLAALEGLRAPGEEPVELEERDVRQVEQPGRDAPASATRGPMKRTMWRTGGGGGIQG